MIRGSTKPIIGEEEINAVTAVLKSGVIAQGKRVEEFEKAFARFIGTRYAIAVNSGTAALHVVLLAHRIGKGDEVITSPFTFISTANSILFTGAEPVFADIDEGSYNICPDRIAEKITPRTRAIIPVHLYGQPCDLDRIIKIARQHELVVIEDACQALGAEYDGNKVGSFGVGCFSFYPTKNITTGEGGMITTSDKSIAREARMIRNHGQSEDYVHEILGYNYRMTDIAAAIGICQLKKLKQLNDRRVENARFLTERLGGIRGLVCPHVKSNVKHVFHQYTVRVNPGFGLSRDDLRERLRAKGIMTKIYYPLPIHKQPLYRNLGYTDHLPNSEKAAREVISLPVYPSLKKEDLEEVAQAIQDIQKPNIIR